jgi:lipid-A-disaccharide synthase
MGLFEVLRHLPRLLRLRSRLLARWLESPPAAFIGVDAPDFNLTLECRLREAGVPTVHYVSPTVWAWRPKRVKKIRRAVDLLLTIFPFETGFLARHQVPARYVGHPLAHDMPLQPDREAARSALGLAAGQPVLALLPGSRGGEVSRLSRPFLEAASTLQQELPDLQLVVPLVNERTRSIFRDQLQKTAPGLGPVIVLGRTRAALAAADVVLVASGTATLEGLLSKRPMVVGYKVNGATYFLVQFLRLVKVKHVAMANLLADERLAPELIQGQCEPGLLVPPLLRFFRDPGLRDRIAARYTEIHRQLCMDTNRVAADAVVELLKSRGIV